MECLYEKAQQSAKYIRFQITKSPKIAVVLGSGLSNLTADFTETEKLPYRDIKNDERFGSRFADMTEPYSKKLRNLAGQIADEMGVDYQEGAYMRFMEPCYETAAEIRAFAGLAQSFKECE